MAGYLLTRFAQARSWRSVVEVVVVIFCPPGGDDLSGEPFQLALANPLALPLLLLVLPAQPLDVVLLGLRGAAQVRVFDLVEALERLGGGELEQDLPARHQVHPIGVLQRLVGVLLDDQRPGAAFVGRRPHRPEEPVDDLRCESERQLVGEQQRRVAAQGSGEGQHLLLAARQHPAPHRQSRFELGEQRQRAFDRTAAEAQVVAGRHLREHQSFLGDQADATVADPAIHRREGRHVVEHDDPVDRRQLAGDRQQRRRLARAVRAEQADHFAALDREVDRSNHLSTQVAGLEAAGLQQRCLHDARTRDRCRSRRRRRLGRRVRRRSRHRGRRRSPLDRSGRPRASPTAISFPKSRTTTWSQTPITKFMSCSTTRIAMPQSSARRRTTRASSVLSVELRPAAGSSSSSTLGCIATARAMARSRRFP